MILLYKKITAMILVFVILICACSSSRITKPWYDPSFQPAALGNVLVVAVRKDARIRRMWEDAFTAELAKHGIVALSSYNLFPDAPPDTNQVITAVQENSFDGVLAILRLKTETKRHYVQGYMTTEQSRHYNSYLQRYITSYQEIEHAGYIDSQKVDIREIDVSSTLNGGRLIWSVTTRTADPATVEDIQRKIASLVVDKLSNGKIISSNK
jgi:hypothetical protein